MKPIIDEGRLYIAQPPLYRAKNGTSIQYLKDELQLEDFLINEGTKNLVLEIPNTKNKFKAISGIELLNIINLARKAKKLIMPLTRRIDNQKVIEQASIIRAINKENLNSDEIGNEIAKNDEEPEESVFFWAGEIRKEHCKSFSCMDNLKKRIARKYYNK